MEQFRSPIDKIIGPVSKFVHLQYTSGIVLLLSVVAAIFWVNSAYQESYHALWEYHFRIGLEGFLLDKPLHSWINDGLMAVFFFVIGLELKREFMNGELSSVKKASLPMVAALGGMLVPAGIYFFINRGGPAEHGWGIPMATDIAFALALLSMAGKHIPNSIKVFLSALAVADDLGAVLVIAFFYTGNLNWLPLGVAAVFLLLLVLGNLLGIRATAFYVVLGVAVWIGFLLSGVHATIAGVLVAFTIPAATKINERIYVENLRRLSDEFEEQIPNNSTLITSAQQEVIDRVKRLSQAAETPLQKIENALHPWVAFFIMPLFALSNAGMVIGADFFRSLLNPVSTGVILALLLGKFFGVLSFSWLMVKLGISSLPDQSGWKHMIGVALLAGVGFTMSLFISSLAFDSPEFIDQAKYGILVASVAAGGLGLFALKSMKV
jgi:NhaA family Na+:H+ antiporter